MRLKRTNGPRQMVGTTDRHDHHGCRCRVQAGVQTQSPCRHPRAACASGLGLVSQTVNLVQVDCRDQRPQTRACAMDRSVGRMDQSGRLELVPGSDHSGDQTARCLDQRASPVRRLRGLEGAHHPSQPEGCANQMGSRHGRRPSLGPVALAAVALGSTLQRKQLSALLFSLARCSQ